MVLFLGTQYLCFSLVGFMCLVKTKCWDVLRHYRLHLSMRINLPCFSVELCCECYKGFTAYDPQSDCVQVQ